METRNPARRIRFLPQRHAGTRANHQFRISTFVFIALLALGSCGTPGEPEPPQPPVPAAVGDLAARQSGEGVVLTFTLPTKTADGAGLEAPPDIEIFRGFRPTLPALPNARERVALPLVYTIPSAVVETYTTEGRVRFVDPLPAAELAKHSGEQLAYVVRTRASKRVASADSNRATVRIYPVPEKITDLAANVTEPAVELRWTAPARSTGGALISALTGYRIYRGELETGAELPADLAKAKWKVASELLGVSPSPEYRDTRFEFGHAYVYTVRSVAQYELDSVESADSGPVLVIPRDTFPPAPPKDLVVVFVPATPDGPAHFDLSWAISPEPDVAGYNVYRSEQQGVPGVKLNAELLPTPTFRDMGVAAGRTYTYTVTVVDRAGNQSAPGVAVSAVVPGLNANEREKQ